MESSANYLDGELKLTMNREKSAVGSPLRRKFLGFCLLATRQGVKIRPHQKAKSNVKQKLKKMTKRNRGKSIEVLFKRIKQLMTGWINYYGINLMKCFMND